MIEAIEFEYQNKEKYTHKKAINVWLWVGVFMLVIQIMLGGITRLTGSGLSITKWEIAVGIFPPLSEKQWNASFDEYKLTPQYQKINKGMELNDFKFIYFWEYFHRLWARIMMFVFLIPLVYFLFKNELKTSLIKDLIIVFLLTIIVALFGWIMVASGLINRPWVNAYKLTIHLNLAFIVFGYLFWTTIKNSFPERKVLLLKKEKRFLILFFLFLFVQLILGGIVSGMKAGIFYPTWPLMGDEVVPEILTKKTNWNIKSFINYDDGIFTASLFQFLHRNIGYFLFFFGILIIVQFIQFWINRPLYRKAHFYFGVVLLIQVVLGILTLLNSKGSIPLVLGVLHQLGAVLLLSTVIYLHFRVVSIKN